MIAGIIVFMLREPKTVIVISLGIIRQFPIEKIVIIVVTPSKKEYLI